MIHVESLVIGGAVLGYLFYKGGIITKMNLGAKAASLSAAARAAAVGALPAAVTAPAKKSLPRNMKILLGIILVIVLLVYWAAIWALMDGVWASTTPGKYLEVQHKGYSNLLWFLFLIPVLLFWNKQATIVSATSAKPAVAKAAKKPLPEWLVWVMIIAASALAFNYYNSSGNVLVNMTGNLQRVAIVTINAGDTIEVHLPGADIDIGGCSVSFGVTPNWRSQHPEVGAVFFDQSGSERGFFQYATIAEPLQSSLKKNGINLEIQVNRHCTVGG